MPAAAVVSCDGVSKYLLTTTSEGSTVILEAMIFWSITDTDRASK